MIKIISIMIAKQRHPAPVFRLPSLPETPQIELDYAGTLELDKTVLTPKDRIKLLGKIKTLKVYMDNVKIKLYDIEILDLLTVEDIDKYDMFTFVCKKH